MGLTETDQRDHESAGGQEPASASERTPSHAPKQPMRRSSQWRPLGDERPAKSRRIWPWIPTVMVIVAGIYLALQYWLTPCTGMIESIERGELELRHGSEGPWLVAEERDIIHEGALIRGAPDTVAVISFPDNGQIRVESAGEWRITKLLASQNGRLSHVAVRQIAGRASYLSRPPRRGERALLRLQVPAADVEIEGVATFTTSADEVTRADILQGQCRLSGRSERIEAVAGQSFIIDPTNPIMAVDATSAP